MQSLESNHCLCVSQDERNQVLTTYLWIRQVWHDAYLKWDKEDYDDLEMINIPSDLVWKPDIVLYNKSVTEGRTLRVERKMHESKQVEVTR